MDHTAYGVTIAGMRIPGHSNISGARSPAPEDTNGGSQMTRQQHIATAYRLLHLAYGSSMVLFPLFAHDWTIQPLRNKYPSYTTSLVGCCKDCLLTALGSSSCSSRPRLCRLQACPSRRVHVMVLGLAYHTGLPDDEWRP